MSNKERKFSGLIANGFLMLTVNLLVIAGCIAMAVLTTDTDGNPDGVCISLAVILTITAFFNFKGIMQLEPNEAMVIMFFGKYKGTFTDTGYYWVNPFLTKKRLSMRARNLDSEPIKVNDKAGNPIMIGLMLVWKLKDTYKAMFEIDAQTVAQTGGNTSIGAAAVAGVMKAFENFVKIQSDAALRQVAGLYAYDDNGNETEALTLREGGDEINQQLEDKLNERLSMAGIEIVEARINYLAYAPEIAAVMLRRQQAEAIISAREKIVEGAVSMVKMALDKLSDEQVVELDDDKKAAMVSNLMVVLCADEPAQPVMNTGTLNH